MAIIYGKLVTFYDPLVEEKIEIYRTVLGKKQFPNLPTDCICNRLLGIIPKLMGNNGQHFPFGNECQTFDFDCLIVSVFCTVLLLLCSNKHILIKVFF